MKEKHHCSSIMRKKQRREKKVRCETDVKKKKKIKKTLFETGFSIHTGKARINILTTTSTHGLET